MNIKERAEIFATKAHLTEVRKGSDIPYILHPWDVAKRLEKNGCDDEVVAAAWLHDVVENTDHSIEEIKDKFGSRTAQYVSSVSDKEPKKSWFERKQSKINTSRDASLDEKKLSASDKIANLRDLYPLFSMNGTTDFQSFGFKQGIKQQQWYYDEMYESLIYNQDEAEPLFQEYREAYNNIFGIPNDFDGSYINKLKGKTKELQKLVNYAFDDESLISEISLNHIDSNIYSFIKYYLESVGLKTNNQGKTTGYIYSKPVMLADGAMVVAQVIVNDIMQDLRSKALTNVKRKIKTISEKKY